MDIEALLNQVNASVILSIMVFVYVIVWALKVSPIFKNNKYLPLAAVILGLLIGGIFGYFSNTSVLSGVVDGAIAGALSSGGHQVLKSLREFLGGK